MPHLYYSTCTRECHCFDAHWLALWTVIFIGLRYAVLKRSLPAWQWILLLPILGTPATMQQPCFPIDIPPCFVSVFSFCNNVFYIGLTPFDFGQQKILPPKTSEEGSDIKYSILLSSGVKLSYCHRDTSSPWFNRTHFCAGEVKLYAVTVVLSHIDRSVYTRFDGKLLCHINTAVLFVLAYLALWQKKHYALLGDPTPHWCQ